MVIITIKLVDTAPELSIGQSVQVSDGTIAVNGTVYVATQIADELMPT